MTLRGLQIPEPSAAASAASLALQQLIAADIVQNGGAIAFARYMELVLYSPGLGYYSGGATKLGQDGDFTTAPEITPLFGQTLAHVCAALAPSSAPERDAATAPNDTAAPTLHASAHETGYAGEAIDAPGAGLHILEFGAGSGKLAFDLLHEAHHSGIRIEQYAILELSGSLRARQQAMLHEFAEVCWLEQLPARFSGVVLANEVLDAMPVHLVCKQLDGWHEMRVGLNTGDGAARFVWQSTPCSADLLACIARQIPDADDLQTGYLTEIHPHAAAFTQSLAHMLQGPAAAVLIDYGFPAHEYYLNQRHRGTLHCHYRHHAHDDPFYLPGLQDITAHVDFSDIARQARQGGLDVLSYSSQAAFLLDSGITSLLLRTDPHDAGRYLPQANALQRLLSPAEMGELFKVLILGKNCDLPRAWERNNRLDRL